MPLVSVGGPVFRMPTAPEIDLLVREGGRTLNGRWRPVSVHFTINCLPGGDESDHLRCHGWISPTERAHRCACFCHDNGRRVPFPVARNLSLRAASGWRWA